MEFEDDDLDWAMGELQHLFDMAHRAWRLPHEYDPGLFHSAWSAINAQPLEARERAHRILMSAPWLTTGLRRVRNAYALAR